MGDLFLSKKEIQRRLNNLVIDPRGLKPRAYGVSLKYFNNDEKTPAKRIDYEVITSLNIDQMGVGEITLDKHKIFYNRHKPSTIAEIVNLSMATAIYPVKTFMNDQGYVKPEINNLDEIIERWKKNKETLLNKYKSQDLDKVLNDFEERLTTQDYVGKTMQHDWFWCLFFHPRLINYGEKRTVERELRLPIIPYRHPWRFNGKQKIEKIPTNYHSFKVRFESEEEHAPSFFQSNRTDADRYFMKLNVDFDNDVFHHYPMHIVANLVVYSKIRLAEKIPYKRIEFTAYQRDCTEYKNKTLSKTSAFITGGLVKNPKNKYGFDNFDGIDNDW